MTTSDWLSGLRSRFGRGLRSGRKQGRSMRRRGAAVSQPALRSEALEDRALLAAIVVTSLADNTTSDGLVTLREAIQAAEDDQLVDGSAAGAGADVITFDPNLFLSGDKTISLTSFEITDAGQSAFVVTTEISILGPDRENGLTIQRFGEEPFRLFEVTSAGNLTLGRLTLTGGLAQGGDGGNGSYGGGGGAGLGGAVFSRGTLTVNRSTLSGNIAQGGDGGISNFSYSGGGGGGGMSGDGATTISLNGASGGGLTGGAGGTVSEPNGATGGFGSGGGGGYVDSSGGNGGFGAGGGGGGYSEFNSSTGGNGNFGGGAGSGIGNFSGKFGGDDSTQGGGGGAGLGGAIFATGGTLNILNSTIAQNSAIGGVGGGEGALSGQGLGGNVFFYDGVALNVVNNTLMEATSEDGAIYVYQEATDLEFNLISNIIGQSIGDDLVVATNGGAITGGFGYPAYFNILQDSGDFLGSPLDNSVNLLNADPLVSALGSYGGPTQTYALQVGSPAIDLMNPALEGVLASISGGIDQRGFATRPSGTASDIGAVEYDAQPGYVAPYGDAQSFNVTGGSNVTDSITVPAGKNRLLVVAIADSNPSGSSLYTPTFGGAPLSQDVFQAGSGSRTAFYFLPLGDSSSPTTNTLDVSWDDNVNATVTVAAYYGVDQTTPIADSSGNSSLDLNLTVAANDLHLDLIAQTWADGDLIPRTTQEPIYVVDDVDGVGFDSAFSQRTGEGTLTFGATSSNESLSHVVMSLKHAAPAVTDTTAPTVVSITRQTPTDEFTDAATLTFEVTFDEEVVNVTADDFGLSGEVADASEASIDSVTVVSGTAVPGTVYRVTVVRSGQVEGAIHLDFSPSQNIEDLSANAYAGQVSSFESYVIDLNAPTVTTTLVAARGTGMSFNYNMSEFGSIYYVVVAANDDAPTAAEIIAGTGSGGGTAVTSGSIANIVPLQDNRVDVTGLTSLTQYKVYVVGVDDASKESTVESVSFTTKTIETEVTLNGTTLVITDINGGNSSDKYSISHITNEFVISDLHADDADSTPFGTAISGATGSGTYQLRVPSAGITALRIRTLDGADEVTIEGNLPTLNDGIDIDLGIGTDTLSLQSAGLNGSGGGIVLKSDIMHIGGSLTVTGFGKIDAQAGDAMAFSADVSTGVGGASFKSATELRITGKNNFTATDGAAITFHANESVNRSENFDGIWIDSATITVHQGDASFIGTGGKTAGSAAGHGVNVVGSTISGSGTANVNFVGGARPTMTADGVRIAQNSAVSVETGTLNIEGYSNERHGVNVADSELTSDGGTISIYAESGAETALVLDASGRNVINASGGDVTIDTYSFDGTAIELAGGTTITLNASADLTMNGTSSGSNSVTGIDIQGSFEADASNISLVASSSGSSGATGLLVEGRIAATKGNITLNGSAASGFGLQIIDEDVETFESGNITLRGTADSGVGIEISESSGIVAAGDLEFIADSLDFEQMSTDYPLRGINLTIRPATPSVNIGVGSGTGTLHISHEELKRLPQYDTPFASITIGDLTNGTGRVEIGDAAFRSPVTVVGGEVVAANLDTGNNRATLIARTGAITEGDFSDADVAVRASEVSLTAVTGVGFGGVSFGVDTPLVAASVDEGGIAISSRSDLLVGTVGDISGAVIKDLNDDNSGNRLSIKVDGELTINADVINNDEGELLLRSDGGRAQNATSTVVGATTDAGVNPYAIGFSPDGLHAYVASDDPGSLTIMSRDLATGALTKISEILYSDVGMSGLEGAQDVDVSADGAFVYVTGFYSNALVVFSRNAETGALTLVETETNGANGVSGIENPIMSVLSPDGNFLYMVSVARAITVFAINPTTGEATFLETTDYTTNLAFGATTLAISPDGAHLYTTGVDDSDLNVFSRDPMTGALTLLETMTNGQNGLEGLTEGGVIVVSPDGNHVYVLGTNDQTLLVFRRNVATGALTQLQTNREVGHSPLTLTISPDGYQVWVLSAADNSVRVFDRDSVFGRIELVDRFELGSTFAYYGLIEFAPDNNHVYVSDVHTDSITTFSRTLVNETINELPNPALGEVGDLIINAAVDSPNGTIKLYAADDITLPAGRFERLSSNVDVRAGRDSDNGVIHQDLEGFDLVDIRAKDLTVSTSGNLELLQLSATENVKVRSTLGSINGYGNLSKVQGLNVALEAYQGIRGGDDGLDVYANVFAAVTEERDLRAELTSLVDGPAVIGSALGVSGTIVGVSIADVEDDNSEDDRLRLIANGGLIVNEPVTNNDQYRVEINVVGGDLVLNALLSALGDQVRLTGTHALVDGTATATDIIANDAVLSFATGIASADSPLETEVIRLDVSNNDGDVSISNVGDLSLQDQNGSGYSIEINPTSGSGDVLITTIGTLAVVAPVAQNSTGRVVLSSTGTLQVGNSIVSTSGSISLITPATLDIDNSVTSTSGDIRLIAGDVDIDTEFATISSSGKLTIRTYDSSKNISVGNHTGDLVLIGGELNRLSDGFSLITIGDDEDGSGTISIGDVTFNDALTLAAPATGGKIHVPESLHVAGSANELILTSPSIVLDANVSTDAGNIRFDGHVQADADISINTTVAGIGSDIRITNGLDGSGQLTLTAGFGDVYLRGGIGHTVLMTALTISSADDVEIDSPRFDLNDLPINITADGMVSYLGELTWANSDPDSTQLVYRLVDNLGAQGVAGLFNDLSEGATITFPGFTGTLTYVGGDGNDLQLVTDTLSISGGEEDDHFIVVLNDSDSDLLQVYRNDVLVAEENVVDVAHVRLQGRAGNDRLTTDFREGFITTFISFDGGTNTTGDKVDFELNPTQRIEYSFFTSSSGTISTTSNLMSHLLAYSNTESLVDGRSADTRVFTFNGSNEQIGLSDTGTAEMRIQSTAGVPLDFGPTASSLQLFAGAGNDIVTVSSLDASYTGSVQINGEDGADAITASSISRSVTIFGDLGHDTIIGSRGNDSLVGGAGNDVIMGSQGNDAIIGGRGLDSLTGGNGDDGFQWSNGDGNDIVDGNSGNDFLRLTSSDVSQTGDNISISDANGRAVIVGQSNGPITGFTVSAGTLETIVIELLSGNDSLDASSLTVATITAFGGRGNDTLRGSSQADALIGGNDNDSLLGNGGDDVLLGGADADVLIGGQGNDRLRGQGGDGDQLSGGAGDDELDGGEGVDMLVDSGDQDFTLSETQLIGGNTGTDTLINIESAMLTGGSSANVIDASAFTGRSILIGGGGNDTLTGGSNNDLLSGEEGDDQLNGNDGHDVLRGGAGHDLESGGNGHDILYGGSGRDTLLGNDGNDILLGQGSSFDDLQGGAGNDTLNGGVGNDYLNGGDDNDHFVWNNLDGNDLITGGNGTDQLVVNASDEATEGDDITVQDSNGKVSVRRTAGTLITGFALSVTGVETIVINAYAGNDNINAAALTLAHVRLNGGLGDDTLRGGSNSDTLHGNAGSDSINGGNGPDTIDTRADETGTDGVDSITNDMLDTVFKDIDDMLV